MPKGVPNADYTGKFKQHVVEDMRNHGLSQSQTAATYHMPRSRVQDWERIYLEGGPEGL